MLTASEKETIRTREVMLKQDKNIWSVCIDVAQEIFSEKEKEIIEALERDGFYLFASSVLGCRYDLVANYTSSEDGINSLHLRAEQWTELGSCVVEVKRQGLGVNPSFLVPLFIDLKYRVGLKRDEHIYFELCDGDKKELIEDGQRYFIEWEIIDSELSLSAKKTKQGYSALIAEYNTKEPLDKGLLGLKEAVSTYYESLRNNDVLSG